MSRICPILLSYGVPWDYTGLHKNVLKCACACVSSFFDIVKQWVDNMMQKHFCYEYSCFSYKLLLVFFWLRFTWIILLRGVCGWLSVVCSKSVSDRLGEGGLLSKTSLFFFDCLHTCTNNEYRCFLSIILSGYITDWSVHSSISNCSHVTSLSRVCCQVKVYLHA